MVSLSVSDSSPSPTSGLRPVNLRTDLNALADLIEISFADTMDSSGRAAIREMRALSRITPGLGAVLGLNELAQGIGLGFVWVENGRLVGNTSVYPANWNSSVGSTWIIANVAVAPEYRGRGIARRLMQASMDMIRKRTASRRGRACAILQVEADNPIAQNLYLSLGFVAERTWHHWRRSSTARVPPALHEVYISQRRPSDWRIEYQLAQHLRPNERGGMGWLRPLHPGLFNPPLLRRIADTLSLRTMERLIVRSREDGQLCASLWIESAFAASTTQLTLMVDPDYAGIYDDALINTAARRFGLRSALSIEHPADDEVGSSVLQRHQFTRQRSLIHMRWNVR